MTTMEQLKLEDTCLGELEAQKRLRNAVLKEAMPKAGQFGFRGDIALAFQEQVADEARHEGERGRGTSGPRSRWSAS